MFSKDLREDCRNLCNFQLRVAIRLKNKNEIMLGHIVGVEEERFEFRDEQDKVRFLPYSWVANVKNAMTL